MKMFKKTLSLCFVLVLLVQSALCTAQAIGDKQTFDDGLLMLINTDYDNRFERFTAESVGTRSAESVEAQKETRERSCPDVLTDIPAPLSPAAAAAKQAMYSQNDLQATKADYKVGDKKVYYDTRNINLVCRFVGTSCTIWVDEKAEINDEYCTELADFFEEKLPLTKEVFGDAVIDTDGDGRIAMFIYDIAEKNVGGYFKYADPADELGRVGDVWLGSPAKGSAHCDCVHLDAYNDLEFQKVVAIHEYQHYIEFCYCYAGKTNQNYLSTPESFLTEGFSCCSEYLICDFERYSYTFADVARDTSAHSVMNWDFDAYELGYVFMQYARTRYAAMTQDTDSAIPGKAFFKTVMESRTRENQNFAFGIIADLLYPELKNTDVRCRQLLRDFWIAVLLKEETGIYGFNGESWADEINSEQLLRSLKEKETVVLRSGMATFYELGAGKKVVLSNLDKDVEAIKIPTSKKTVIFDYNDGTGHREEETFYLSHEVYRETSFRFNYLFLGWATTPDATKPDLQNGQEIRKSMTLYAVWKPATAIDTMGVTYYVEDAEIFSITPEYDAEYAFNLDDYYCDFLLFDAEGKVQAPIFMTESIEGRYAQVFRLTGGKTYDIHIYNYLEDSFTAFSVERDAVFSTLTYVLNIPENDFSRKLYYPAGTTQWAQFEDIFVSYEWSEYFCWYEKGLEFVGWAETPDATQPKYEPYAAIELPSDKTLYAIWTPMQNLIPDQSVTVIDYDSCETTSRFAFTPSKDATFNFRNAFPEGADGWIDVYENGLYLTDLFFEAHKETENIVLRGGRTYVFEVCVFNDAKGGDLNITLHQTKNKPEYVLSLRFSKNYSVVYRGDKAFDIPFVAPFNKSGSEFLGWSETQYDTGYAQYNPGDRLTLVKDKTLYPVWADSEGQAPFAQRALYVLRFIVQFPIWAIRVLPHLQRNK